MKYKTAAPTAKADRTPKRQPMPQTRRVTARMNQTIGFREVDFLRGLRDFDLRALAGFAGLRLSATKVGLLLFGPLIDVGPFFLPRIRIRGLHAEVERDYSRGRIVFSRFNFDEKIGKAYNLCKKYIKP